MKLKPLFSLFSKNLSKHFKLEEFACKDGSSTPKLVVTNLSILAIQLETIRVEAGNPVLILSGYRSPYWNKKVGGARKSQHLLGKAADITISGWTPFEVADLVEKLIKDGKILKGGVGRYPTFTHYDIRGTNARWSSTLLKDSHELSK